MSRRKASRLEHYSDRVVIGAHPDECWGWNGTVMSIGYAAVKIGGRSGKLETAHRLAYELFRGTIPDGMDVCHSCDNRVCCNPRHLFLGTRADNMRDAAVKGRLSRKLSNDDVAYIRASNERPRDIAKKFGIAHGTVNGIQRRRQRVHIP